MHGSLEYRRERRTKMEWYEVPDQGHAPLLEGDDIISRIGQFVTTCELDLAKAPAAPAHRSPGIARARQNKLFPPAVCIQTAPRPWFILAH